MDDTNNKQPGTSGDGQAKRAVLRTPRSKPLPPRHLANRSATKLDPATITDPNTMLRDRPLLVRTGLLRYAYKDKDSKGNKFGDKYRKSLAKSRKVINPRWMSICVTIPREIIEVCGLEQGMTMVIAGYLNRKVVIYPAGDVMKAEDLMI